ncbi:MAG: Rhodanese domain protein [Flavipsychrobacter sp.]|nr:Rhodanese domain protein [Flavipsychrobacter sp.]
MIRKIKKLLGIAPKADLKKIIQNGAIVVDVRSPGEYASGHIKGSLNIPVSLIPDQMHQLKKDKAIITCCASGIRSNTARTMLLSNGFTEVYNAGKWNRLLKYTDI